MYVVRFELVSGFGFHLHVHTKRRDVIELSSDCQQVYFKVVRGCTCDYVFLVVLTDNLDNFLCDNHKVVIVTIRLTTF